MFTPAAASTNVEPIVADGFAQTAAQPAPAFDFDRTFELHSRPAGDRVIYLDFDGETIEGTMWNDSGEYGTPMRHLDRDDPSPPPARA
jgi:hypothetical protein